MRAVIRAAASEDLPLLEPLWRMNMEYHAALAHFLRPAPDGFAAWARHAGFRLAAGTGMVCIAWSGEEPAGFIAGLIEPGSELFLPVRIGYISELYVHPNARRHGLGRLLFWALRDWFAGRGVQGIEVQAYLANIEAGAFWRRVGGEAYAERLRVEL